MRECNTLNTQQHTATHSNTQQHTATHGNLLPISVHRRRSQDCSMHECSSSADDSVPPPSLPFSRNTLQRTATKVNLLPISVYRRCSQGCSSAHDSIPPPSLPLSPSLARVSKGKSRSARRSILRDFRRTSAKNASCHVSPRGGSFGKFCRDWCTSCFCCSRRRCCLGKRRCV